MTMTRRQQATLIVRNRSNAIESSTTKETSCSSDVEQLHISAGCREPLPSPSATAVSGEDNPNADAKKRVSFKTTCQKKLVPHYSDYTAKQRNQIWYSDQEMAQIKESAVLKEQLDLMKLKRSRASAGLLLRSISPTSRKNTECSSLIGQIGKGLKMVLLGTPLEDKGSATGNRISDFQKSSEDSRATRGDDYSEQQQYTKSESNLLTSKDGSTLSREGKAREFPLPTPAAQRLREFVQDNSV